MSNYGKRGFNGHEPFSLTPLQKVGGLAAAGLSVYVLGQVLVLGSKAVFYLAIPGAFVYYVYKALKTQPQPKHNTPQNISFYPPGFPPSPFGLGFGFPNIPFDPSLVMGDPTVNKHLGDIVNVRSVRQVKVFRGRKRYSEVFMVLDGVKGSGEVVCRAEDGKPMEIKEMFVHRTGEKISLENDPNTISVEAEDVRSY